MKKKRNFYISLGNGCKAQVDYIYEYESSTAKNGRQRFYFGKSKYGLGYAINDSKTGTTIMRGLTKMSKINFIKICQFVLAVTDVKGNQERFPRVSKLKLYEDEDLGGLEC